MPKLPSRDDLGPLPSVRAAPMATLDTRQVGSGAQAVGAALDHVATGLQRQSDQDEQFEVERRLIEHGYEQDKQLDEARTSATGDGRGFAESTWGNYYQSAHDTLAKAQEDGLSPRALQRLDVGLLRQGRQIQSRALTYERSMRDAAQTAALTESLRTLQNDAVADDASPSRLSSVLERGYRLIDASRLTPAQRRTAREAFRLETQRANVRQRAALAAASDNPVDALEGLVRDVMTLPSGTRVPDQAEGLGSISAKYESGGRGVGFISSGRHDPGGPSYGVHQLSGASSMAAFLRSPEGEPYRDQFGDAKPATPAFNRVYREIAESDPQAFAEAQKAFYTRTHYEPARATAEKVGFDTSNRAIQEALFSIGVQHGGAEKIIQQAAKGLPNDASIEQQVQALYEARTKYVENLDDLPEDTRQSVLNRYREEEADVLAMAGESGDQPAKGGARTGFQFSRKAPYDLSTAERLTLRNTLQTELRATALPMLQQGLEAIVSGDDPPSFGRDAQGRERTALDLARVTMAGAPHQLQRWERQWEKAVAVRDATRPIYTMPVDDLADYAFNDIPAPARQAVTRRIDRLLELYRDPSKADPARAVSGGPLKGQDRMPPVSFDPNTGMPTVINVTGNEDIRLPAHPLMRAAYDTIRLRRRQLEQVHGPMNITQDAEGNISYEPSEGQDDVERRFAQESTKILIDARLAAQRAVGLQEYELRPITRDEAQRLLRLPSSVRDERQFRDALRAAVDRAEAWYGPYARMALETAIGYRGNLSNEQRSIAGGLLGGVQAGSTVSRTEADRTARLMALDRAQRLWTGEASSLYPETTQSFRGFAEAGQEPGNLLMPTPEAPPWAPLQRPSAADRLVTGMGASMTGNPTPAEINLLMRNPRAIQGVFDAKYGAGAAARFLQAGQQ